MKYELRESTKFKKDLKKIQKRSKVDLKKTFMVLKILEKEGVKGIPISMKPH